MSTDTDRITNFSNSFHEFWSLPFQVAGCLYLLYQQVSPLIPSYTYKFRTKFINCQECQEMDLNKLEQKKTQKFLKNLLETLGKINYSRYLIFFTHVMLSLLLTNFHFLGWLSIPFWSWIYHSAYSYQSLVSD